MEELHQLSDQESTIAKRQTLSINKVVSGMYPNYKVKDPGIRGPGEPPIPKGWVLFLHNPNYKHYSVYI